MGVDQAFVTSREAQAEGRSPSCARPCSPGGHSLRSPQWYPLGDAPPGDGLRQWHDLLAPSSRLAKDWRLGPSPPSPVGSTGKGGSYRLEPGQHRCLDGPRSRGGEKTGKNPTDRGKQGTKRHLVVDRQGIPLAILLTAANVNETTMLEPCQRSPNFPPSRSPKIP